MKTIFISRADGSTMDTPASPSPPIRHRETDMMRRNPLFKTSLIAASLLGLSACGEGSEAIGETPLDGSDGAAGEEVVGEEPVDEDAADATEDTDEVDTPAGGADASLSDATPRFLTMACGAMPIADVDFSSSASAPAVFTTNTIVSGRIDPESGSNTENFWSVDLQPGFYHLVQDATRLDGRSSNLGLEFTDVSGPEADASLRLLSSNEIGFHIRDHVFLEIERARTMTIRVTPRFGSEDYAFGLFGNGTAVPSPFFDDCPTITPLSLGTTEALTLTSFAEVDDEQWYSIDLEAQDYVLSSTATRTDGTDRNIIYIADFGSQFGKTSRFEEITRVNELGIVRSEDSSAVRPGEAGEVWVRLRGSTELNLEFTLQTEN